MRCTVQRLVLPACSAFLLAACSRNVELPPLSAADSLAVVRDNIAYRSDAAQFFSSDPDSPFLADTTVAFTGLNWFPIDPRFRGRSVLHRYERAETVTVMGTGGETRKQLRYGWFTFPVPGDDRPVLLRLNVYRPLPEEERSENAAGHLAVWFTDRTTGIETYEVGRYVNVGTVDPDPRHLYTIDLNKAYNPYCAYSAVYSCAIPREDDRLPIAVRVGEKTYRPERVE
jgi:uncharacterized protein (DUF1684 family)